MELSEIIGHKKVVVTDRGNSAIYASLLIAKQLGHTKVLVVDQSGWTTHKTYPKELGFDVVELKTDDGLITKESLEEHSDCVLLYQTIAGYFAEQDLEMIYSVAKKNNLFLIEDICPSIGLHKTKANISVCSFRRWKPVNLGTGGCISFNENYEEIIADFISKHPFTGDMERLSEKLKELPARYELFFDMVEKVKHELKHLSIVHPEKQGVNVVVLFNKESERAEIMNCCEKYNLEYEQCPRYIRLNKQAISIEIKRL
ncbi:MAG TPA: DegT/DnrJ/EryC1/StrS family aminotransferase [Candidatus Nanoarchaeia archaeon]|nr:DegT/DnrJ/EryC1/StrS family aminotransferase [Candidatus Nanoarchaeia archaeon]